MLFDIRVHTSILLPIVLTIHYYRIVTKEQTKAFFKVHVKKLKPAVIRSFILRKEYIHITRLLEEAEMEKWANGKQGRLRDRGIRFDYRVSRQLGSGMNLCP